MTPNPMVAMAAPAPDTRYAPREMPRGGSRSEGPSFESRLNQAEAKPKAEPKSQGASDTKPQEKPEVATEEKVAEAPKAEQSAEEKPAEQEAVQPTSVADLASMSALAVQPPVVPEIKPAAPEAEASTQVQAVVQAPAAPTEAVEIVDPVVAAAVAEAIKTDAIKTDAKAEKATKGEAKPTEDVTEAEAETLEVSKPAVPVKPVAQQSVPSSLDGLRAEKGLMSLRASLDGAPRTETAPAPARTDSRPIPATLDEVTASVVDEPAAEAPSVKPWEISEPVRAVVDPQQAKTEQASIKSEPVPVKEAITRTFVQAQKSPDRPAELRLQLNPEHLGRMELQVKSHEGAVSAVIRVEHVGVRDLVENQLAALRTTLADQGIKIDRLEVNVSNQGPRDQQSAAGFDFGRQAFGQDAQRDPSGQQSQGNSRQSGWNTWGSLDADEPSLPEPSALSGFDAQA